MSDNLDYSNETLSCSTGGNDLIDRQRRAERICQLARKKCKMIINQAENRAEKMQCKAKEDGYREGLKLGREEGGIKGEEEFFRWTSEILSRIEGVERRYYEELENLLDSLEPRITELVLEIVGKIVLHHVEEDEELIMRTIKDAFRNLSYSDSVILSVHSSEIKKLSKRKDEVVSTSEALVDLEITTDATVNRGGCLVSSSTGIIDARIESKLEEAHDLVTT
ncbi:MAG: hypothetical protein K8T10_22265 [Candidatus Eremiobacteraeota bacterium]|nr:hypothetical protein [Candidatus Eremiobacteraeota bacterium]